MLTKEASLTKPDCYNKLKVSGYENLTLYYHLEFNSFYSLTSLNPLEIAVPN